VKKLIIIALGVKYMLGEKLKFLRKKHNIKQSDLAVILGVTRSQVSAYEVNQSKPSFKVLMKLAEHFKMSVDYFYENQTDQFIHALEMSDADFKNHVNLFFAGEKLTDDEIQKVIDYIRFLRFNKSANDSGQPPK
jgi:transcriptional regulator with XRE-family HTH domain